MPWDGDTTILTQRVRTVATTGAVLGLVAAALCLSGSTRAAGLALLPSTLGLLAGARYAQRRGQWPKEVWILAFLAFTLIALSYATMVGLDAVAHRTIHAVPV
ncbi:MAG TPA: hypothetical protein VGN48_14365 [Pedococcus sp.]|jgi:hypothetical protein|nr:hypothetical protein [Pedococcus sp.]